MVEWEYMRYEVAFEWYSDEKLGTKGLLELGKQGWEAVRIIKELRETYCVLLKRPKRSKEDSGDAS